MRPKQIVYLLHRSSDRSKRYIGLTSNLNQRLKAHNTGKSPHTSTYHDWKLSTAIWFEDEARARELERYLKTGSGIAFANRHLWPR